MRPRRRIGPLLLPLLGALLGGCAAATIPPVHSQQERMDLARRSIKSGDYNVAVELLKNYVQDNPGGADVDQAIELLGEAYLGGKEWPSAQAEFERLLRDYPESDSAGTASYRLGEALWGQARGPDFDQEYTEKALDQWETYLRDFPGHWLNAAGAKRALEARSRLAVKLTDTGVLYLKLKRAEPARIYFRRVLDEYGDTPSAAEAELGLALADLVEGKRGEAAGALRDVETRYAGKPVAERASHELARLERQDAKRKKP